MGRAARRQRFPDSLVATEAEFRQLVDNERRRSERSGRPFLILQVRTSKQLVQKKGKGHASLLDAVCPALRETDRVTWFEAESTLCVLCTETGSSDEQTASLAITQRLREVLAEVLPPEQLNLSLIRSALIRPVPDSSQTSEVAESPALLGIDWQEAIAI